MAGPLPPSPLLMAQPRKLREELFVAASLMPLKNRHIQAANAVVYNVHEHYLI